MSKCERAEGEGLGARSCPPDSETGQKNRREIIWTATRPAGIGSSQRAGERVCRDVADLL